MYTQHINDGTKSRPIALTACGDYLDKEHD